LRKSWWPTNPIKRTPAVAASANRHAERTSSPSEEFVVLLHDAVGSFTFKCRPNHLIDDVTVKGDAVDLLGMVGGTAEGSEELVLDALRRYSDQHDLVLDDRRVVVPVEKIR
jgi:hypothetical protein